ncbi:MAG: choice-of-anchor tandem repeat GloVer-containing protein, partial [Bacteroidia bacterium]
MKTSNRILRLLACCFLALLFIPSVDAQTRLYNIASEGGYHDNGTILSVNLGDSAVVSEYLFPSKNKAERPGELASFTELNGKLYAITQGGGACDDGVLFEYDFTTNTYRDIKEFCETDAEYPQDELTVLGGKLYGVLRYGGANGNGLIFEYDPTTDTYSKEYEFPGSLGYSSSLTAYNGMLWGTYLKHDAVFFAYDPVNNVITNKPIGNSADGISMDGKMVEWQGTFYGCSENRGTHYDGFLFSYVAATGAYTVLHHFVEPNGEEPALSMLRASNGKLYGLTQEGGTNADDDGTLFEFDLSTNTFSKKHNFTDEERDIQGRLLEVNPGELWGLKRDKSLIYKYDIASGTVATVFTLQSGSVNTLREPRGSLFMASNGMLYGMTQYGGTDDEGGIFEYDPVNNAYTTKIEFGGSVAMGKEPFDRLTKAGDRLYGVTRKGGVNNEGTIFEFDPATNSAIKLADFSTLGIGTPYNGLTLANNGKLYGSTDLAIYEVDPLQKTTTKHYDFTKYTGVSSRLKVGFDGKFYGIYGGGGVNRNGLVFSYDVQTSTYDSVYVFPEYRQAEITGSGPIPSFAMTANGLLYGTTSSGGQNSYGVVYSLNLMTGAYTKLIDIDGTEVESDYPGFQLIDAQGIVYGKTWRGGTNEGSVFSFTPSTNTLTTVGNFDRDPSTPNTVTGAFLAGDIIEASNGRFYGATGLGEFIYNIDTATGVVKSYYLKGIIGRDIEAAFVEFTIPTKPILASNLSTSVCAGTASGITFTLDGGSPAASHFEIVSITPQKGLKAGNGNAQVGNNKTANAIAGDTWTNNWKIPRKVVYSVLPVSAGGLTGDIVDITLTVNPGIKLAEQGCTGCGKIKLDVALNGTAPNLDTEVKKNTAYKAPATLVWYDDNNGRAGRILASRPTVNTANPGTFSYWVAQQNAGCAGAATKVEVSIASPAPPAIAVSFCPGQSIDLASKM